MKFSDSHSAQLGPGPVLHTLRPGFFSLNSEFPNRFLTSSSSLRSAAPSLDTQKSKNPLNMCDHYCMFLCKDSIESTPLLLSQIKRTFEKCWSNSSCGLVRCLLSWSEFWQLFSFFFLHEIIPYQGRARWTLQALLGLAVYKLQAHKS